MEPHEITTKHLGLEGVVWFLGKVEDVKNDPLQLGRIRVRPFGENNEDLKVEELRWATPLLPITSASLAGVGISPTGIEVGSYCFGFYLDGKEKQQPIVLGTFPKIPDMDFSKHDVSPLARGENPLHKQKVGPEPGSAYKAEYPYNKVLSTSSGHVVEIDDTPGGERIHIYHKSGSYEEVNSEGRRVTKTAKDNYEIIVGDDTVYVKGKLNITVVGDANISANGNVTVSAGKDATVKATNNVNVKAKKINLN